MKKKVFRERYAEKPIEKEVKEVKEIKKVKTVEPVKKEK